MRTHTLLSSAPARGLALAAALAGSLAAARTARADDGAVIVVGSAALRDRALIAGAVEGTARDAAWSLGPALAAKDIDVVVACLAADRPWPCIEPVAKPRGLLRLVVVHAARERADGALQLVLTGQLVLAGHGVPTIDRRYCAPCGDTELAAAASELTRRLLRDSASRARLELRAAPPEGEPTTREVALAPAPAPRRARPRIAPLALIGAGALAIAGGAYASLTTEADPTGPQDRYLYSGAGIGAAVAGAAAIGAGLVLWLRPRRARSAPMLSFVEGGGVAGWTTKL